MAADVLRLRLALWANGLRRDTWRFVALLVGALAGVPLALLVLVGLAALRSQDPTRAGTAVVLGGALLLAGWTLLPLVTTGVDASLDPRAFATLSVPLRRLVAGLLLAGVVGVPGGLTAVVVLGTVLTWSRGPGTALVALVSAVLGLLTAVAASRAATTAAADALRSRRGSEVAGTVGLLLVALVGPLLGALGALATQAQAFTPVARVLAWTPLGLVWAAPADAALGAWGLALLRLAGAAAVLLLLLLGWAGLLRRRLTTWSVAGTSRARARDGLLDRLPEGPRWAVAARCLRGWRRDSRYLVAAVSAVVAPLALVVVSLTGPSTGLVLAAGPLTGFLLGLALHNDVALDGTAFWVHLAAGVRGADDRWGRAAALLCWALPVAVAATLATCAVAGRLDLAPGLLALSLSGLLGGTAVSSVVSAVRPYPAQQAGDSPFARPDGAGLAGAVVQLVVSALVAVLTLPVLALVVAGARTAAWLSWAALVLAVGLGVVELVLGTRYGGRLLDRRGPEVLAVVRRDR